MAKPRDLKKMTLPVASLNAMPSAHRSAILMLGLLANDVNWLRKLLIGAVVSTSDTPDGRASFSLTMLMATTLASKIHEGWSRIRVGWLCDALSDVDLPDEVMQLRGKLADALVKDGLIHKIRKTAGFHYPSTQLDFCKLAGHIDDTDATIYLAPEGYGGDVLSHLSTLAGIEPLLALNEASDYRSALVAVWNELTEVAGAYCRFISDLMALVVLKSVHGVRVEDITIPDALEDGEASIRFFVHPPPDLDELRRIVDERR
jgi:hypothetical protein